MHQKKKRRQKPPQICRPQNKRPIGKDGSRTLCDQRDTQAAITQECARGQVCTPCPLTCILPVLPTDRLSFPLPLPPLSCILCLTLKTAIIALAQQRLPGMAPLMPALAELT